MKHFSYDFSAIGYSLVRLMDSAGTTYSKNSDCKQALQKTKFKWNKTWLPDSNSQLCSYCTDFSHVVLPNPLCYKNTFPFLHMKGGPA